ncbi:hypothetical protein [Mobilicoccus sp.]|uniref:hypothetical protein n=1 Tax=Mobilicoccus sp. TaxID=2034349 RepID=UPI0028A06B0B|nr:hypothetical protein [Mobilicoccus sp.]
MTVTSRHTLFPLEQHTWVVLLTVAVGFGVVGSLALLAGGEELQALLCLPIPLVFGYTARSLCRPTGPFRRPVARVLNLGLVVVAVLLAALAARPLFDGNLGETHPLVLGGTAMAVLIQVAVVIVAVESVNRLAPGDGRTRQGALR